MKVYGLVLRKSYLLLSFRANMILGFVIASGVKGSRGDKSSGVEGSGTIKSS